MGMGLFGVGCGCCDETGFCNHEIEPFSDTFNSSFSMTDWPTRLSGVWNPLTWTGSTVEATSSTESPINNSLQCSFMSRAIRYEPEKAIEVSIDISPTIITGVGGLPKGGSEIWFELSTTATGIGSAVTPYIIYREFPGGEYPNEFGTMILPPIVEGNRYSYELAPGFTELSPTTPAQAIYGISRRNTTQTFTIQIIPRPDIWSGFSTIEELSKYQVRYPLDGVLLGEAFGNGFAVNTERPCFYYFRFRSIAVQPQIGPTGFRYSKVVFDNFNYAEI